MVTTPTFNPIDGEITSLAVLPNALNGSEVQEIVSPGNANQGNSYQVTTATLAAFYSAYRSLNRTVIESGATVGAPYAAETTDTEIFVQKLIASATFILMPAAATMAYAVPVLVKDWKGDANINPITISFSGGEVCDGQNTVVIQNAYGWVWLVPGPGASMETGWGLVG